MTQKQFSTFLHDSETAQHILARLGRRTYASMQVHTLKCCMLCADACVVLLAGSHDATYTCTHAFADTGAYMTLRGEVMYVCMWASIRTLAYSCIHTHMCTLVYYAWQS
jgi:hypothetical protein